MIRCLVSGVLHADPVSRISQNGNPFATAKLRADDGKGGSVWCNLIGFSETSERLATLKAGASLSVAGRAEVTAWLDRDGEPKGGLSLVVDELATLRGKPKPRPEREASETAPPAPSNKQRSKSTGGSSPIPFDDMDDWTP